MTYRGLFKGFAIAALTACLSSGAFAQACTDDGSGFAAWMANYKRQAAAEGISNATLATALDGVTYDAGVIGLDRNQKSFKLTFEQFYARRVSTALISRGQQRMAQNKPLLDQIEARFGVPREVIISIWGLETNYGTDGNGGRSIIRSLATLAHDCRRSPFFTNELTNALRIVDKRDKSLADMRGGWAGEIGPMQFLPSSYVKHAVDFDGDGRRDLFRSVPDMLASTANFLKSYGWKTGQPYGPGTPNHEVLRNWNKAEVYVKTIAMMAERMGGRAR
jgi:lytic murein transglycosylase